MHPLTRRIVLRTPRRWRGAVELVARTIDDTLTDRVPGLAAEIAFFVIFSVPPLLMTVLAMARPIGQRFDADFAHDLEQTVQGLASNVFTPETIETVIMPAVRMVTQEDPALDVGVLGLLVAVWAASRATKVLLDAIRKAYNLETTRPGWRQRLSGLVLTVIGMAVGLVVVPVMVAGPRLGEIVSVRLGVDAGLGTLWRLAYWPGVMLVTLALIAALYHYGTPWSTPWRRDLPGAVLAMSLWLAGSAGLRVYATQAIVGGTTPYGPIAGPVVVLVWIYLSAFALLLGAELNAEIERMWPVAPQKGEDPVPDRITEDQPAPPPDDPPAPAEPPPTDDAPARPTGAA